MPIADLILLLPCHSLEDFPTHHRGSPAAGLLAAWTSLWHPSLIDASGKTPAWHRADSPPDSVQDGIVVIPEVSQDLLPTGFTARAAEEAALVVTGEEVRERLVAQLLDALGEERRPVDAELAGDFLALGYAFLQIELLTRQMRYTTNLDEAHFFRLVTEAAREAVHGESDRAREKLGLCFDLLGEERDHYYSVDVFIVELLLVADTTLGPPLQRALACHGPLNVMVDGSLLATIAERDAASLTAMRDGLNEERIGLVGGMAREAETALLPLESLLSLFHEGLAEYERLLGRRPVVFGRRRSGYTPVVAQLLGKLGFKGLLHTSFDEGRCPDGSQAKTRLECPDGSTMDALARAPLAGDEHGTYLSLAARLGDSMDMDHVATLFLAHWPGHEAPWLEDIRRASRYGPLLGRFVTLDEYFSETNLVGHGDRFDADQYRVPYLSQAVEAGRSDPLSHWQRMWSRHVADSAAAAFGAVATLVDPARDVPSDDARGTPEEVGVAAGRLAQAVTEPGDGHATLLLNPHAFVNRTAVAFESPEHLPAVQAPVYAASRDGRPRAVVDVPSCGYAWLTPGSGGSTKRKKKAEPLLAEDDVLRNEFFEARIDKTTGALRAIRHYKERNNRLSQQLAVRLPGRQASRHPLHDPNAGAVYSVMAADEVKVDHATTVSGQITTRGRLLDLEGNELARFEQRYRVERGSRVLSIDVKLETDMSFEPDPWKSYLACRFAWGDEGAKLCRAVNQLRSPAENKRLEAPGYLLIDEESRQTTMLTGGLPYHLRVGFRSVDSLLVVRGESARSFKLGIGIDVSNPAHAAEQFLQPPVVKPLENRVPRGPDHAWLLHVDARNLQMTWLQPMKDPNGGITGFRCRLLETAGRASRPTLRAFRPVREARLLDLQGAPLGNVRVEEGTVRLDVAPHEWLSVEATF